MAFLLVGLMLLLCKWLGAGPVAQWDWWVVLLPFALAVAWWAWADYSGLTKRRAVERENRRRQTRIDKSKAALGLGPRKSR